MYKIYAPIVAVITMLFFVQPSFAQDVYLDTVKQNSSYSGVEKFIFHREYFQATTESANRAFAYYPDSALSADSTTAATRVNNARPTNNPSMYSVNSESLADVKIRQGTCPGIPGLYGCMQIDSWTTSAYGHLDLNTWYKATIWIVASQSGAQWTSDSRSGAIAHELLHLYGLNDQYVGTGCNANRYTLMDRFYITGGYYYPCDSSFPTQWDKDRWNEYKKSANYSMDYYNNWASGTTITYWRDQSWSDHQMEMTWQWSNSATGPWTNFALTNHINHNGSHQDVSPANGWRIMAWVDPWVYGITNKYLRACSRPIYNWTDKGSYVCSYSYFFPY